MHDVATLVQQAVHRAQESSQEPLQVNPVVRKLFMLLHGSYGNSFISKFSTGEKDKDGRDKGIRAAMKVWEAKLGKYPADVIEVAADRTGAAHPEFPPSLPQFEKLCEAAMPRKTYAQEHGLPALPAPKAEPIKVDLKPKNDGKDWARVLLARFDAGEKLRPIQVRFARQALGMEGRMPWQGGANA